MWRLKPASQLLSSAGDAPAARRKSKFRFRPRGGGCVAARRLLIDSRSASNRAESGLSVACSCFWGEAVVRGCIKFAHTMVGK